MQSINYPSSLSCSQSAMQAGFDASMCRQWQISNHANCNESRINSRDENDVVARWVDTRRTSFRYSLEVLIGQLDRRLSLQVAKGNHVVQRRLKKKGEATVPQVGKGKKNLSGGGNGDQEAWQE